MPPVLERMPCHSQIQLDVGSVMGTCLSHQAMLQTAFSGVGSLSTAAIVKTRTQLVAHGLQHHTEHSPKAAALGRAFSSRLEALHASCEHLVQARPPHDLSAALHVSGGFCLDQGGPAESTADK